MFVYVVIFSRKLNGSAMVVLAFYERLPAAEVIKAVRCYWDILLNVRFLEQRQDLGARHHLQRKYIRTNHETDITSLREIISIMVS